MKNVYSWYMLARALYLKRVPILPGIVQLLSRLIFSCSIPYTASIGDATVFNHQGLGVVIHENAIIGSNCLINPGVVVGGTSHKKGAPKIGNRVLLGAGTKIIGPITIGDNVAVGANSVVVSDITDNCLVVGAPARVIKVDIDIQNYL